MYMLMARYYMNYLDKRNQSNDVLDMLDRVYGRI